MSGKKTVISEMQIVEEALKVEMQKAAEIEKRLRTKLLTTDQRAKLESELEDVKNVLAESEKALKDLRNENTRSFMVAASFAFACFLLYGLYTTIFGGM